MAKRLVRPTRVAPTTSPHRSNHRPPTVRELTEVVATAKTEAELDAVITLAISRGVSADVAAVIHGTASIHGASVQEPGATLTTRATGVDGDVPTSPSIERKPFPDEARIMFVNALARRLV